MADRVNARGRLFGKNVLEVRGHLRVGIARPEALAQLRVEVDEPGELGELVEVAHQVGAPVAQARQANLGHNFQTFPLPEPFLPVALRRSTTSDASSTSRS